MKLMFVGAGAVGGYFGGRLVQSGHDVSFLVRAKRRMRRAKDASKVEAPQSTKSQTMRQSVDFGSVGSRLDRLKLPVLDMDEPPGEMRPGRAISPITAERIRQAL
jgi:2-dehydropantoate 2-reductase